MDRGSIVEIKSMAAPPALVKRLMQAVVLLLGVDEGTSANYGATKKIFTGSGFLEQVRSLNATEVHPEIAARAQEIINECGSVGEVKRVSSAMVTVYKWCEGFLKDAKTDATPANIPRQREIFSGAK